MQRKGQNETFEDFQNRKFVKTDPFTVCFDDLGFLKSENAKLKHS